MPAMRCVCTPIRKATRKRATTLRKATTRRKTTKRKTSKKKAFATCMSKRLKGKKYRNRTSQKQHMARAARVCSRQIK